MYCVIVLIILYICGGEKFDVIYFRFFNKLVLRIVYARHANLADILFLC
jgi:hypothetical protein